MELINVLFVLPYFLELQANENMDENYQQVGSVGTRAAETRN